MLGYGYFARVYPAKAYKQDQCLQSITFKKEKVVKLFSHVDEGKIRKILNEYELMKRTPHLGVKKPVFFGKGEMKQCILIMNRLPGSELTELINQNEIKSLSIDKKFELISKLLFAYYYQVYDANLVHRDIKPENIIVQINPEIKVNFCDYGLAKPRENTQDNLCCGTASYVAPEVFYGDGHTSLSDVFSVARIITLILTSDSTYFNIPENNPRHAVNLSLNASQKVDQILKNQGTPFEFDALIKSMLNPEPSQRPDIRDTIAQFHEIFPELKTIDMPLPERKEVNHESCLSIQKYWSNNSNTLFNDSSKITNNEFQKLFEQDLKTKGIILCSPK